MRNVKRLLVLVLAVLIIVSVAAFSASAAKDVDYSNAAKRLTALNILKGDGTGNLMLENGVTRYQAALFFVQALTGETTVERWNAQKQSDVFADVPEYGTAIDYAYAMKLIMGRGNGEYGYNDPITYRDMLVMAVRALGYETPDMPANYPNSYIVVAEKLGLTDNIASDVMPTQALKRGETAQIIWDMLDTEIAYIDPATGKPVYPGEKSVAESIAKNPITIERKTLLEEAGFSRDEIRGVLVNFVEGKTSSDVDTVDLVADIDGFETTITLKASDLGITKRTVKDTYLGMPATIYVDETASKFASLYDVEDEDCGVSVLFHELTATEGVKCLGDGNIKYTESNKTLTLGSTKYSLDKVDLAVYMLGVNGKWNKGWTAVDAEKLLTAFDYDAAAKKYTDKSSPYGEVRVAVMDKGTWGTDKDTVNVYFMPYEYAKYVNRTATYRPTASSTTFTLLAKYETTKQVNMDGTNTVWVERFLNDGTTKGTALVQASYYSVSEYDGEKSMSVKTMGETVRANDMIMYYYNYLDNILYIGQSYGAWKTGKLTGTNQTKETVKINGVEYGFGFEGGFNAGFRTDYAYYKNNIAKFIAEQDGNNNVYYFPIGNNVVRVSSYTPTVNAIVHDYAIITTDAEIMAKTLGMTVEKYENALNDDGWYLKNGIPQVAMLNKSTGNWQIISVGAYEYGAYDMKDNEFDYTIDMAEMIELADNYPSFKNKDRYETAKDAIQAGGILMIRKNAGGVYTLAREVVGTETGDAEKATCLTRYHMGDGIVFSDTAAKTNLIKSDPDDAVKTARVTMTASSITVVIDKNGNVGIRKGIQKAVNSVKAAGYFYSATAKLIVLKLDTSFDVAEWASGKSVSVDELYYVALDNACTDYERLDNGDYAVTISNLFNLKTLKVVPTLKITVEDSDGALAEVASYEAIASGDILHMNEDGELTVANISMAKALENAMQLREPNSYNDYKDVPASQFKSVVFEDDSSITLPAVNLTTDTVIDKINVSVVTLDLTDLDKDEYDYTKIALNKPYKEENDWDASAVKLNDDGDKVYLFPIEGVDTVTTVTEPTRGVFDMYFLDNLGGTFLIPQADADFYEDAAEVKISVCGRAKYYPYSGTLTFYVLRTLELADN